MDNHLENHLKMAAYLARLLDDKFKVLGVRFGIDPIIGLIPGGGDLVSFIIALYIVWIGVQMELPGDKITRMLRNITLDLFLGLIPVIGDIADIAYKSNLINLEILKQHAERNIIEGEVIV